MEEAHVKHIAKKEKINIGWFNLYIKHKEVNQMNKK